MKSEYDKRLESLSSDFIFDMGFTVAFIWHMFIPVSRVAWIMALFAIWAIFWVRFFLHVVQSLKENRSE